MNLFYKLRSILRLSYFGMWGQDNRFVDWENLWGPWRFCPPPSSFGEQMEASEMVSDLSTVPQSGWQSPRLLAPNHSVRTPSSSSCQCPTVVTAFFAWMPPRDVRKTNDSLAVWFLSPLDKLAACQCAWQTRTETKAGKKWSSPPWLTILTERSSPILSSLDTLTGKCEALYRVKPSISVRLKEQLISHQ